ncbi:D site albumin promoter binding protein b isoform X2 [Neoarius graeffei]|uniref:D site albumin promoter binding protein b isoform X2 n=1 Tax=Neoarius graeffei TaxID=443677 RepID=UPI00298C18A8|nr:D site albumin promoter binding protein b isoform X2 [Neoarius graeffei]
MMAGPPSQRLLPPSGPKTHFRSLDHAGGDSLNTGPVNTGSELKSPPQTPLKDKDRLDMDEDSLGRCSIRDRNSNGQVADGNGLGTGAGTFQSLWERTVASDPGLFQLHYMDLGEFLTENGMAMHGAQIPSQSSQCPSTSPSPCSSSSSSSASAASPPTLLGLDMQVQQGMLGAAGCLHSPPQGSLEPTPAPSCPPLTAPPMTNASDMLTTFDPDPADVALSSVPCQEAFDPRTHCFSEEDLKPQPVIKKARKMLVPDNLKDDKYWSRRLKNNEAAKRSRDARRVKENQISVRAAFLERENAALRQEVANMRKELGRCRNILNKYESRYVEQL